MCVSSIRIPFCVQLLKFWAPYRPLGKGIQCTGLEAKSRWKVTGRKGR